MIFLFLLIDVKNHTNEGHSQLTWQDSYANLCEPVLDSYNENYDPDYEYIEYLDDEIEEKYHVSSSSKEKPHKCTVCNASFRKTSHLKRHVSSVHDGIKPYECTICGTRFTQNGDLTKHIRAVHEKIKPHKCTMCDASFAKTNHLQSHMASIHCDKR